LAPELIAAGRTLLMGLDAQHIDVEAAFWLLDENSGSWHLVLGARSIRRNGAASLYDKITRLLAKLGLQDRLWIGMVSIVDQGSPIVRALDKALGAAASVDGARLDNATVDDIRMPASLLYRLSRKQRLLPEGAGNSVPPTGSGHAQRDKPRARQA
jgi:hypothetical protein